MTIHKCVHIKVFDGRIRPSFIFASVLFICLNAQVLPYHHPHNYRHVPIRDPLEEATAAEASQAKRPCHINYEAKVVGGLSSRHVVPFDGKCF